MDFLTHTLVAVGTARLIAPRDARLPQCCLAAMIGALLPDSDSALALIGMEYYGKYHRVISHSILGLGIITPIAAVVAWALTRPLAWRRFGWFVSDNLPNADPAPAHASISLLLPCALLGTATHWVGDWITGFGGICPFWPWSMWDASLRAVNSFDAVLFSSTLAWHISIRRLNWPRRGEAIITAVWFLVCASYVIWRLVHGPLPVW